MSVQSVCVILAAGLSTRFGSDKLKATFDGTSLAKRALDLCAGYETFAVVNDRTAEAFASARLVLNDAPERGMSHSLRLADIEIAGDRSILVVLADMPRVDPATLDAIDERLRAGDVDVVVPTLGGRLGHPVGFGPNARRFIATLADGDTVKTLRDRSDLRRGLVAIADVVAFDDVDVPADLNAP